MIQKSRRISWVFLKVCDLILANHRHPSPPGWENLPFIGGWSRIFDGFFGNLPCFFE